MNDHFVQCFCVVEFLTGEKSIHEPVVGAILFRHWVPDPAEEVHELLKLGLLFDDQILGMGVDQPLVGAFLRISNKNILICVLNFEHFSQQEALFVHFIIGRQAIKPGFLVHMRNLVRIVGR